MNTEIYEAGRDAYHDGESISENPYDAASAAERDTWDGGYLDAEAEDEQYDDCDCESCRPGLYADDDEYFDEE